MHISCCCEEVTGYQKKMQLDVICFIGGIFNWPFEKDTIVTQLFQTNVRFIVNR